MRKEWARKWENFLKERRRKKIKKEIEKAKKLRDSFRDIVEENPGTFLDWLIFSGISDINSKLSWLIAETTLLVALSLSIISILVFIISQ
ncbi:MAG: hypothetical protein IBX41_08420 [Methanophagales archaeon]|nr:hypothetical protein [Methanophagales archaeon]